MSWVYLFCRYSVDSEVYFEKTETRAAYAPDVYIAMYRDITVNKIS